MLKMYTVYDSKVGAYMPPMFLRSAGEAVRMFEHTVQQPDHSFAKNPEDFTLFELGEWDELTAQFSPHVTPISLGVAIQFVKPLN